MNPSPRDVSRAAALFSFVLAVLLTLVLVPRGGFSQTSAREAAITLSNRLTPARDARVIRATLTPRTGWQSPYLWRITIGDTVRFQRAGAVDTVVDTLRGLYVPCVQYRVTVRPVGARDSLTRATRLCRGPTRGEAALIDSYPALDRAVALCGASGDTVTVGRSVPVVLLGRNRYTGAERVLVGSTAGLSCR